MNPTKDDIETQTCDSFIDFGEDTAESENEAFPEIVILGRPDPLPKDAPPTSARPNADSGS